MRALKGAKSVTIKENIRRDSKKRIKLYIKRIINGDRDFKGTSTKTSVDISRGKLSGTLKVTSRKTLEVPTKRKSQ